MAKERVPSSSFVVIFAILIVIVVRLSLVSPVWDLAVRKEAGRTEAS